MSAAPLPARGGRLGGGPQGSAVGFHDPSISPPVVGRLLAVVLAIHFDHQSSRQAGEVGEIGADRNLPVKLLALVLAVEQAIPEPPFSLRHVSPQLTGVLISHSSTQKFCRIHGGRLSGAGAYVRLIRLRAGSAPLPTSPRRRREESCCRRISGTRRSSANPETAQPLRGAVSAW